MGTLIFSNYIPIIYSILHVSVILVNVSDKTISEFVVSYYLQGEILIIFLLNNH